MGCVTWSCQMFCLQLLLLYSQSYAKLCSHDQSSALLQFKQQFSFESSSSFCTSYSYSNPQCYPKVSYWIKDTDCCSWDGVTCDMATGHVIGLELNCSCLYGNIPSNSSLFFLPHLQKLNLADNDFNHSNISPGFGKFPSLRHLTLSSSNFSGQLPPEISHLCELESLDLSWNYEVRLQEPVWKKLVQNLTKLKELSLDALDMSNIVAGSFMNLSCSLTSLSLVDSGVRGNFPESTFCLPNLQSLFVTANHKLSGVIPKANWSSGLSLLDLSFCSFTGSIPTSFGNLTQLTFLTLARNNFIGHIPSSLSNLGQLFYFDLSSNIFSGEIPDIFVNLTQLSYLDFSGNQLTGAIPSSVGGPRNLATITLSSNFLNGIIPSTLLALPSLENIDLGDNNLTGSIPCSISELVNLTDLRLSSNNLSSNLVFIDLSSNLLQGSLMVPPPSIWFFSVSNNQLTGKIPASFGNLSSLVCLDLSNNSFSGTIPENIGSSKDLLVLDLRMNNFNGNLPQTFAKGNALITLNLNGNKLKGPLPPSLVNCSSLEVLDVGNNRIKSTFPDWLADLPDLQVLILRSNRFHGPIGNSNAKFSFAKLRILDLSRNKFSGGLPARYFQDLKAMMHGDNNSAKVKYMERGDYGAEYYSAFLTVKGNDMVMERILTIFTTIDLSSNRFQGHIPEVVGNLSSLKCLNFSHNNLTGGIPSSLANLTALESLDLSSNNLVWEIPEQLTNLISLSVLNLSYNKLEGPIPRGPQFNTFSNSSYIGNSGLCGFPLSQKCSNGQAPESAPTMFFAEDDGSSWFDWKIVMMGYACGLVIGLSMGYLVFATGRPWWLVRMVERMQCNRMRRPRRGRRN